MTTCDTLICDATVVDGTGGPGRRCDVMINEGRISRVAPKFELDREIHSSLTIDAAGLTLSPGFIDVHTHDDLAVIHKPAMMAKISQGVTTVIVGNCGISAAPVELGGRFPDPMNLLGSVEQFRFPTFAAYSLAIEQAHPAVNVGALVGHTSLRNNHVQDLDRSANQAEIEAMRAQVREALEAGALGLSTGLAYLSACNASTEEVLALTEVLTAYGGLYTTHMRTEGDKILEAMDEALLIGAVSKVPVVLSHLKCAGPDNWGRSAEVLQALEDARGKQRIGCDCYPYAAGSSTLDLRQVDERVKITITWSIPCPDVAGQTLKTIATTWNISQLEAAARLMPAGAIYHSISEDDMRKILAHPATMIGSDGLPNDPRPHPRLWGTFPRVLGEYCRAQNLMTLPAAVHKMTGMPAQRFGLSGRGLIQEGYAADLVLFNAETILDTATYDSPMKAARGIEGVWVNGALTYTSGGATGLRAGRFLRRTRTDWIQ